MSDLQSLAPFPPPNYILINGISFTRLHDFVGPSTAHGHIPKQIPGMVINSKIFVFPMVP